MERSLKDVLSSQKAMLERLGAEAGGAESQARTFQRHLAWPADNWRGAGTWRCSTSPYAAMIADPAAQTARIGEWMGEGRDGAGQAPAWKAVGLS